MIDTIRLMLKVDPQHIKWEYFQNCKNYCAWCKVNEVLFNYYYVSGYLLVITNAHKVLNKDNILLSDCEEYIEKIKKTIEFVIDTKNYDILLNRIDYYVDIKMEEEEKEIFMNLIHKHDLAYKYARSKKRYDSSVHLNNKSGSFNINIYDKYVESGFLDKYKGTVRVEIQNKKALIKRNLTKYGIPMDLKEYWSKSSFFEYFVDTLKGYTFFGDYYKYEKVKEIIEKSSYGELKKYNLKKFVEMVNLVGMENVKKQVNRTTIKNYISILNELKVSPYCIDKNSSIDYMENILSRCIHIANEKYFNVK